MSIIVKERGNIFCQLVASRSMFVGLEVFADGFEFRFGDLPVDGFQQTPQQLSPPKPSVFAVDSLDSAIGLFNQGMWEGIVYVG